MAWWEPLLRLEIEVMFQHLTPNPYDTFECTWSFESVERRARAKKRRQYQENREWCLQRSKRSEQRRRTDPALREEFLKKKRANSQRWYEANKANEEKMRAIRQRRNELRRSRRALMTAPSGKLY